MQSTTDSRGGSTAYGYSSLGNMTKVSSSATKYGETSSSNMETTYGYDSLDRLTSIMHNGFAYFIDYDIWGNVIHVRVGLSGSITGNYLVTYTYGTDEKRSQLQKASYANGGTTEYTYDGDGNVTQIVNSNGSTSSPQTNKYQYYYDSTGKVICEYNEVNAEPARLTYYNDNSVEIYSNGGLEYYASYDKDGNFVEIINGVTYTAQTYNPETVENNTVYKSSVAGGDQTVGMTKTTDAFGRTNQKSILSKSPADSTASNSFSAVVTDYTYKTYTKDEKDMASSRIDTLKNRVYYGTNFSDENVNDSLTLAYDYDDNNNITYEYSVSSDGTRTVRYHYTYDEVNQLVRVDDNVVGKSYVYTYDVGGNRISTNIYAYSLGALGEVQRTITQTYGLNLNNNLMYWKDRLKTYDGKTITYDLEGNPTSYDGKTYIWNGKQLSQVTAADGSYTQYNYDINGLRTQKRQYKSNGNIDYTVDYVWSDGKIVTQSLIYNVEQEKDGVISYLPISLTSKFVYADGEDSPCAIMLNGSELLLERNLQGDVIKIVNASDGSEYVSFTYDAWGNVAYHAEGVELDDTMRMLITALCPVTYRGYNYDFTTGLYYLQSRYYNPEWGRFLNTDDTSILLSSTGTVLGANMYAYCNNNPVNRVDYSGNYPGEFNWIGEMMDEFIGLFILFRVGGYEYLFNYTLISVISKTSEKELSYYNLSFYNNKKYYVIKMTTSYLQYWRNRKENLKHDILDFTNGTASGFLEGSLEEISNGDKEGIINMFGDIFNCSVGCAITSLENFIPVQYYSIMRKYEGNPLVVALSDVKKTFSKTHMKSIFSTFDEPNFYDRIEVIYY